MVWPPLVQCGALPAGGSWQLQERSLPGGRSEVLKQLHVLNEKFKNKGVDSCLIFIGHFCGVKDWDQPFSKWISEFGKRADFVHPITLRNFCNSTIENIESS